MGDFYLACAIDMKMCGMTIVSIQGLAYNGVSPNTNFVRHGPRATNLRDLRPSPRIPEDISTVNASPPSIRRALRIHERGARCLFVGPDGDEGRSGLDGAPFRAQGGYIDPSLPIRQCRDDCTGVRRLKGRNSIHTSYFVCVVFFSTSERRPPPFPPPHFPPSPVSPLPGGTPFVFGSTPSTRPPPSL